MKKLILGIMIICAWIVPIRAQEKGEVISFDEYLERVRSNLPELKANGIDILTAENEVKRASAADDISLTGSGKYLSENRFATTDVGKVAGYEYSAGLSKTITRTGTSLSTSANYDKNDYNGFTSSPSYSTYTSSVSVRVSQPILYNFLGKVDRFSEKDARMKADIAKIQLDENNKSVLTAYRKAYYEWSAYRQIYDVVGESVRNFKKLRDQIRKNARTGLSDEADYQTAAASLIDCEGSLRSYQTKLRNIEHNLNPYIDCTVFHPDNVQFLTVFDSVYRRDYRYIDFNATRSHRIIELSLKRLEYSRDINTNKLLPQLNLFTEITRKNLSTSPGVASSLPLQDYAVGFEFSYKLGNNDAESNLESVNLQMQSLLLEYESTGNAYRKNLSATIESIEGTKALVKNYEDNLAALNLKLAAQKRKYAQGRLSLSDIIDTQNAVLSKTIEIIGLKYQMIAYCEDYTATTE